MLQHNLTIAWRNFKKEKFYAWIKIGGFALGIAACLMIALYIQDELKFDTHLKEGDRLYRVIMQHSKSGEVHLGTHFPAPMAEAMKRDFPEIQEVARVNTSPSFGTGNREFRRLDKEINTNVDGFTYVDPAFIDLMELEFVMGDRNTALQEPNTILIPEEALEQFFDNEDPIGMQIILDNDKREIFTIDGVIKDPSVNSHFPFKYLMTLKEVEFWPNEQTNWASSNYITYFRVAEGTDVADLESKFQLIIDKYIAPALAEININDVADHLTYRIQAVPDIHLKSGRIIDGFRHGDIRFVWLFAAVAFVILLLACINFINLSTAKAANRAKEVGLRKTVGGSRRHLIVQFLTESILYSLISFALGIILTYIFLPFFNEIADKDLSFPIDVWWTIPALVTAAVFIGAISGVYPALYLSGFKPIDVLKGSLSLGSKSSGTRSALVVFQFATSIALIISTIVISRQVNFILNKDIGYNKEKLIMLEGTYSFYEKIETLKEQLGNIPEVAFVTITNYLPVEGKSRNGNLFWQLARRDLDAGAMSQRWQVDEDYVPALGLELTAGRNFSREMKSDSSAAIVSESFVKALDIKDPIGFKITNGHPGGYEIIGVFKDFHFESLKGKVQPLCLNLGMSPSTTTLRLKQGVETSTAIKAITKVWNDFSPNQPIRYSFVDEEFKVMHNDITRMGTIFSSFAILSIIIACLGLLALSAYVVEQRKKEISVHLVLGASIGQVFRLLTFGFLKLVLIAAVIASPIAWLLLNKWLRDYAYRITIGWDVFAIATFIALFIALATLSYQSIKAAMLNPAESLRS